MDLAEARLRIGFALALVALGRPGQPVELAAVYVLLASQEASFITGEVYGVTGGAGVA